MRTESDYFAATYADECEAMASVGRWQQAGWTVVGVDYRPEYRDRPWLLWLRVEAAPIEALIAGAAETPALIAVG